MLPQVGEKETSEGGHVQSWIQKKQGLRESSDLKRVIAIIQEASQWKRGIKFRRVCLQSS